MALKTIGPQAAAKLDQELMSEEGGYSIDQLMELAGLSVSQAVYKVMPPSKGKKILIACGPGNNGGDGLVCARHLHHYGYSPTVFYPQPTKADLFTRLQKQLRALHIPFTEDFPSAMNATDLIVDALFGFSFHPPVRSPFDTVISLLESAPVPVLAVDTPSSWNVDSGPPEAGQVGSRFMPQYLISLTAAKPSVSFFKGKRHFIGGRFLGKDVAERFGLDVPDYRGVDQIAEVPVDVKVERL